MGRSKRGIKQNYNFSIIFQIIIKKNSEVNEELFLKLKDVFFYPAALKYQPLLNYVHVINNVQLAKINKIKYIR